jgi:hypothetical protein
LHVDLVRHLPGRLRLRSAVLKGDARASEKHDAISLKLAA